MEELAIYATMKARPGREGEVEALLESLLSYAEAESGTKYWFALRGHDHTYSIFDTFDDQSALETHLNGRMAEALTGAAIELFEGGVQILSLNVLAGKNPRQKLSSL